MIALVLGGGDIIRVPPHHWRVRHQEIMSDGMADRLEASEAAATIFPLRADQPAVQVDDLAERREDITLIRAAINRLNPVEAFILRARFGLDSEPCTREVVAAQTGLSVAWVAKIQNRAMEHLRTMLDDQSESAWKEPKLKRWLVTLTSGKTIACNAKNKSDARAMFKEVLGIASKGRLPKGTVVEEVA